MGWISKRHMQRGGSLNAHPERQRKGPLRTIVSTIHPAQGMFSPARVELECGHVVSSDGQFKARCDQCARASSPQDGKPHD